MDYRLKFKFSPKTAFVVALLAASTALACGPDFPWQLLDDRTKTLKAAPKNSFAYEAAHLIPARDRFVAVEQDADMYAPPGTPTPSQVAEQAGLSKSQAADIDALRQSQTGDQAMALPSHLPKDVQLYTAGAVDFQKGAYAAARPRFAAVLALPPDQSRARRLWAAFALARMDALAGDSAAAQKDFASVRDLAAKGVPDSFGFATASYGEEARLHFLAANALLEKDAPDTTPGFDNRPNNRDMQFATAHLPAVSQAAYGREMAAAAALYAAQAADHSKGAVQSLRVFAANMLAEPGRLDATIADPLLQKILVAYAMGLSDAQASVFPNIAIDAGWEAPEHAPSPSPVLVRLADAMIRNHVDHPAAADRLAALAYRTGHYMLAQQMAEKSRTPLSEWVKAKISLQQGDMAAAQKHYAQASQGFPVSDATLEDASKGLLRGESGTLALARGQYVEALTQLYPVANLYWGDVAHVAERVLTTDELKAFVDANVPAGKNPACAAQDYYWGGDSMANRSKVLRQLLARRLMRDGRTADAMAYFCDHKVAALASDYARALSQSHSAWRPVSRARALFYAATIARQHGMEIMGTEVLPDYAVMDGSFEGGVGQDKIGGAFVTAGEKQRFAANAPAPNLRFHYRYVAADEAAHAADMLPPRSQAFAAVLCDASSWMLDAPGSGNRGWLLYQRYVKQGAHMKWASQFGRQCPAPDFAAARWTGVKEPWRSLRHTIRPLLFWRSRKA